MANLLLPIEWIARFAKANFLKQTRQTEAVQEKFLMELLRYHENTEFGREYHLQEITTIDEFRQRVPVLPYSSYEPYTEKIAKGEQNILTPDPVVYINMTSGSTGKAKMIPITKKFQNSLGKANLATIGFLIEGLRQRKLPFGKVLATGCPKPLGVTEGKIEYGPASTGVLRMGKFLYSQLFANPFESLMAEDYLTRHYVSLLFALRDRDLRGIAANFPLLTLQICGYLEEYGELLIRDIAQGSIASQFKLEVDLRVQLERMLFPDPARAGELKEILQSEGILTPKSVWPELSFIVNGRGGTSDFYFRRFSKYFDNTPVFGALFSSAEGTFSVYPDLDVDGSILAIESGFFEFIPPDQWDEENPQTLLPREVEVGQLYRVLMTNYSGFYRYDIGDVIEVVGFQEKAPLIVFRYRRGGLLSSVTEKTSEAHVTKVMEALQEEFGLPIKDFCITLSEKEIPPHYLVNIELAQGQELKNPEQFLNRFDEKLKQVHTYYEVKRRDRVPSPRLRILAPGSFATVRERQLAKGIPDFQIKFPHITEDRDFLAGLTVLQELRMEGDKG